MWSNQGGGYGGADQGAGGGGFSSPGTFNSPATSSSQDTKKRQRAQNIIPCTVGQITKAEQTDDKFVINGVELYQVTLVGLVRSVKESSTRIDYEIDDMTGPPFDVKQFVDNDENQPEYQITKPMIENTYVRVYGNIRAFGGKRNVVAFRIVPVLDLNELTMHILEVMHSHMKASGTPKGAGDQSLNTSGAGAGNASVSYAGAQGDNLGGLNNTQQQVQMIINSCTSEQGVSVNVICGQLRGVTERSVREAIDFLSGEGHIYSTIDDDHFRSTDSV